MVDQCAIDINENDALAEVLLGTHTPIVPALA